MRICRWLAVCAALAGCDSRVSASALPGAPMGLDDGAANGRSDEDNAGQMVGTPLGAARAVVGSGAGFMGQAEEIILDRLTHGEVKRVRPGSGGRSVGFKITFEDGTKAYYKPEQTFSAAHWYAEIAAYYLDRALGLGRVPPVVSRRMPWKRLERALGDSPRRDEVVVGDDGSVRGALIWWLPRRLVPLETPPGFETWLRVETWHPWLISPYQRPATYVEAVRQQTKPEAEPLIAYQELPRPERPEHAAALSDMIVFDFMTLNLDRWGGGNCNVLRYGREGPLIFLDNGAGFSPGPPRRSLMDERLEIVQRFRRSTIDALRALDLEALREQMRRDPLGPILHERQLEGLAVRRQAVLDHVDELHAELGDAVYSW